MEMEEDNGMTSNIKSLKDVIFKVQTTLFEGIRKEAQLEAAAEVLSQSDYDDVVEERTIARLCGYPLCNNKLPEREKKGRYRISLKEHKVYDVQETWLYCSSQCLIKSRTFSESLPPDRNFDLAFEDDKLLHALSSLSLDDDKDKENEIASTANNKSEDKEKKDKIGITVQEEKFSSQLVIQEQENGGGEKIVVLDYAGGPPDAIEGYVPQRQRQVQNDSSSSAASKRSMKKKGAKKTNSSSKGGPLKSEPDFTSTIIVGESCAQLFPDQGDKKSKRNKELLIENNPEAQKLKSALKTQVKQLNRSVTWADEKKFDKLLENGNVDDSQKSLITVSPDSESTSHCDISDKDAATVESLVPEFSEENVKATRLESAEAIAKALTEAADAVASGESDANEAVAKAGISVLPGADENPEKSQDDVEMLNSSRIRQIWPSMSSNADEESYEAQDYWYDSPPDGFCLELSPFAKMWMALDRWITASSVAYLYGRDESGEDSFSTVNARVYPRKIISGALSAEIEKTLASCISRALPGVAKTLRLSTPISTLEQALGHFLKSMTLVDAIPAFRTKQWYVIVALFLDALSVNRLPSLGPQMMSNRPLIEKILDAADMTHEEYAIMRELLIPLGRHPEFSSQSGG